MTEEFYKLLERFSIMTIDAGLSDAEAIKKLKRSYTPELIQKLIQVVIK